MSSMGAFNARIETPAEADGDERVAHRYSMILRIAKLVGSLGEIPCIVRDISTSGARVKLFNDPPLEKHLFLELSSGQRYAVERIWQKDGQAGLRFAMEIDVAAFVAESSDHQRRPLRFRLRRPAILAAGGVSLSVTLLDLSQHGAGIESEHHLALAQQVTLAAEGLAARFARVRWRRKGRYGLAFAETIELSDLARLAFQC